MSPGSQEGNADSSGGGGTPRLTLSDARSVPWPIKVPGREAGNTRAITRQACDKRAFLSLGGGLESTFDTVPQLEEKCQAATAYWGDDAVSRESSCSSPISIAVLDGGQSTERTKILI